jgi:choline dehydrogenase-like flavoprotein
VTHALAPTGKRILLLERGGYVPRERDNWSTRAVNLEGKYQTREVWRDAHGRELHPHTNYYVGGNTKFYGAALFRLRREDFGEVRHWGGISPPGPSAMRSSSPITHRPSSSITSTASAELIPLTRPRAPRIPIRR